MKSQGFVKMFLPLLIIVLCPSADGQITTTQTTTTTSRSTPNVFTTIPMPETGNQTKVRTATVLPENCSAIYQQGSSSPYNNTKIVAVFQTFCSIRQRLAQCIADHQQQMINGSYPIQWSVGLLFNRRVFEEEATQFCNNLPAVANDLECLKSNASSNASCESVLLHSIPTIFKQFRNGSIKQEAAQAAICGVVNSSVNCHVSTARSRNCSKGALQSIASYNYRLFYGMCASGSILDSLPPEIKDSAFVICFFDSFSTIIEDIVKNIGGMETLMPLINRIMQHICPKTEELSQCIIQRSRTTVNEIDRAVLQFVNVTNIKRSLDLLCRGGLGFLNAMDCLSDVPAQFQFCAIVYYPDFLRYGSRGNYGAFTTPASPFDFVQRYCPPMKQYVDCTYLPVSRCNRNLTLLMNNMVNITMTDRCRNLADRGQASVDRIPNDSTFVKCGYPLYLLMAKEIININDQFRIVEIIQKGMDIVCRNAKWYLSCLDQRLPSSTNYLDRFFNSTVDFSSSVNRTQVINSACQKLPDLKSSLGCMVTAARQSNISLVNCTQADKEWALFKNKSALARLNPYSIRATFCGPIQRLITCARQLFGNCSRTVDTLMENGFKAILRTDCGGVRPSTTVNPGNGNSGNNGGTRNAANTFNNVVMTTNLFVASFALIMIVV